MENKIPAEEIMCMKALLQEITLQVQETEGPNAKGKKDKIMKDLQVVPTSNFKIINRTALHESCEI